MPARDDFQNCLTAALTLGPRLPLVVRWGSGAGHPPVDGRRAPVVRVAQFGDPPPIRFSWPAGLSQSQEWVIHVSQVGCSPARGPKRSADADRRPFRSRVVSGRPHGFSRGITSATEPFARRSVVSGLTEMDNPLARKQGRARVSRRCRRPGTSRVSRLANSRSCKPRPHLPSCSYSVRRRRRWLGCLCPGGGVSEPGFGAADAGPFASLREGRCLNSV